ncbi:cyanoexosortase B system-associated protein [Egbenema bharatensis]|uniref:cyanoexosortase B system-associated protein n=1 Tax=Egbenema bharatensis TaxID=3463334 RepID=UPI003A8B29C8
MLSPTESPKRILLHKFLLVIFVLAIVVFLSLPNYRTGQWTWNAERELSNIQELRLLQQQGLSLPGWQTVTQQTGEIGGRKWSIQGIVPTSTSEPTSQNTVWLLLRPQTWHRDMPQVDWMDINGVQQWTADSNRSLQFTVPDPFTQQPIPINTRFLRGWNQQRTYAVLQWYAWANGGHPAPARWFWVDQRSQLFHRTRTAWIAVSLLIPIKPLGDIETVRSQAQELGQLVQTALMEEVLGVRTEE